MCVREGCKSPYPIMKEIMTKTPSIERPPFAVFSGAKLPTVEMMKIILKEKSSFGFEPRKRGSK